MLCVLSLGNLSPRIVMRNGRSRIHEQTTTKRMSCQWLRKIAAREHMLTRTHVAGGTNLGRDGFPSSFGTVCRSMLIADLYLARVRFFLKIIYSCRRRISAPARKHVNCAIGSINMNRDLLVARINDVHDLATRRLGFQHIFSWKTLDNYQNVANWL